MTTDDRTPEEIAYDNMKSGAAYVTPETVRTIEDLNRAQIDAWNRMDENEQLFAAVITHWYDNLAPTHQAMGQAGMILLGAACDGVGPEDTDADEQEQIAARIHHAAYTQGYDTGLEAGVKATFDQIEKRLEEKKVLCPA